MANQDESPDNVIALSRYRAQLGRGKRLRRADVLLASPDPERAIRALPGDELYYVIQEIGLREAGDILVHARAEQVQAVMDFSLWQRDQLLPERMAEWIEVMSEAPPEKIGEWIAGLDTELVGLLITQSARIYDLSQEEPPDQGEGILYPTPDRLFVLDAIGFPEHEPTPGTPGREGEPPESARAMIRIIDGLYRADQGLARRLLIGARSEMTSSLEEMALRWRSGRMSDLGFADYYEALEVYRELDPASVRIGEVKPGTRLRPAAGTGGRDGDDDALRAPAALIERLGTPSVFARAVRRLTSPDEVADLHFALVALTNRVLAADRITPGDDEAVAAALARLTATLDIAVEFLARGDEDRALEAVRTVSLVRLHRLGVSLVGKVRKLALALKTHGPFAAAGRDLFEPEDGAVVEVVTRLRPLFPGVLETPPKPTDRPFASMADIARAMTALERAAAAQALLVGLGVRAEQLSPEALAATTGADAAALDAGVLARTALVLAMVSASGGDFSAGFKLPMSLRPLSPDEIREFEKRVAASKIAKGDKATVKPGDVKRKAKAILDAAAPKNLGEAVAEVIRRWVDSLAPLEPVLVKAPPRRGRRR